MESCQSDSQPHLPHQSLVPDALFKKPPVPKTRAFPRKRKSVPLLPLSVCMFRAECSSQEILDNSADLAKRAKFICFYLWCDDLESPRWKVLRRYGKIGFFKCWGCLEGGGGLCMAIPAWGVQSGFPYGQFLGFILFQICINGPLKEAKLLKTADNKKGGGELQASSK